MRTLTPPLKDNLQRKKKGVEPVIILGVEWTPGHETLYADRQVNGAKQPFPILNDMGNFNMSQVVSGSSATQNVKFALTDVEEGTYTGHLKNIIDNADIHKAKARLYLMVQGVNLIDRTLLIQGEINSPLKWDEGDRILSFNMISQIESVEAGFAIEDGDFPEVPEDLRGKPWPMIFGNVCWEKTQRVRSPRKGFLVDPIGVVDFTLNERLCQARLLTCAAKYEPPRFTEGIAGDPNPNNGCTYFRDTKSGNSGCICPDLPFGLCPEQNLRKDDKIDTECLNRRFNEICRLIDRLSQEEATVVNPFEVRGGSNFPQNETIRLWIEGVVFIGIMTGTSFLYDEVIHPQRDEITNPPCKKISEAVFGWRKNAATNTWARTGNGLSFEYIGAATTSVDCDTGGTEQTKVINGSGESWRYYEQFVAADFIGLDAGTEVFLEDESEILHIVNLFGGTVTGVAAYRQFGDQTILTNLPTEYYTVRTTDYGSYSNVQEISLTQPLKIHLDEDWEEDVYVKATSNVGPNPADCIKFLVDTYLATSGITMDIPSFDAVKAKVANYPIGTMVTARPSVFSLIDDIAYQSRCAAVIRDGKLVLIYLSEAPTPIRTLTMADIVPESVRITHGDTEELKTRHDIQWSKMGASINKEDGPEQRLLLKWNIPLYGTSEVEYDYYTQNTFSTILKSATFWIIREATTWQRIHFETPLSQIDLDAFDAVALNIPFFPTNTTVIIEDASYDATSSTIKFRCWTPVRAGETFTYLWAWPAQQDSQEKFPLQKTDDGRSGDALGFNVSPPLNHVLSGGFKVDDPNVLWAPGSTTVQTDGDRSPSDLDDVLPNLDCPDASDALADIRDPFDFQDFKEIANRQDDHFENNQESFTSGGSTDADDEPNACGDPHGSDVCTYEVIIQNITPKSVTTTGDCPDGGPCGCPGPGRPCTGSFNNFCHRFGALWAAQQFRDQKNAEAQLLFDNCDYLCGVSQVWQSPTISAIPGSGGAGECEAIGSVGDPEATGAQDGEISAPGVP